MLDDRTCISAEPHPYTGEFIWTLTTMRSVEGRAVECAAGSDGVSIYTAPGRAEDTAACQKHSSTGALDLFLEERTNMRGARRHGVSVEMHVSQRLPAISTVCARWLPCRTRQRRCCAARS
jgi:hypothetical protein